jgi:Protein of unknown function (DUF5656)
MLLEGKGRAVMAADRELSAGSPESTAADQPAQNQGVQTARSDLPVGSTMESSRQPVYGQGIVVSLISAAFLLVLAILAVREDETVTGTPATETTGPLFWGLAVVFTLLIGVGAQYSEISAARAAEALGHPRKARDYPTAWIIPMVGMAGSILLVATLHNTWMFVVGPALAFFAVGGSLLARDLLDDATEATLRTASTVHTVVIHVVAFFCLSAVYLNKMSLWAAVPLVAVFSFFLIVEALDRGTASMPQRVFYASLGSLLMAMATIFLDWWLTYGWTGGGVLLVCFYVVAGILLTQTQKGFVSRRDILEFLVASIIVLAILIATM